MYHQVRFTAEKIARRIALIEPYIYRQRLPLAPFRYLQLDSPLEGHLVNSQCDDSDWKIIQPGQEWGAWRTNFILRTKYKAPHEWVKSFAEGDGHSIALYLPLGDAGDFCHPEALAYIDGNPYAACDRYHQEIILPTDMLDEQEHSLALPGWTGLGGDMLTPRPGGLRMGQCALIEIDQFLRDFVTTARITLEVVIKLETNHPSKDTLLTALDASFKDLETLEPFGEAFYRSVEWADQTLREGICHAGAPLPVELVATGHAHIDVAWLWTIGQTRRKAGRTFYNVIRLMERHPQFHFTQSQPQLYDFVRQDYPDLFRAIQTRVVDGQWEPIGGMWVEADCNLSGPESLVRQFLLGRGFYRKHFDPPAESPVLWLPDVFGYAWNLPQLIREAGLKYFFTIKIGWSQYNRLPYDTFWWQGLDGTRVLTHFSTSPDPGSYASTYNAMASPAEVIGAWENIQQKELRHPMLMAYGFGDGGGGPTEQMIANLAEMSEFPAVPRVRQGSVGEFFAEIENTVGADLPVWNGELYLELHRGTYTTQGRNKLANRRSEFLLHDAEFLATYALLLDPSYSYPYDVLHRAWELVCLNQFHDIIPGSSIGEVYVESLEQYEEIERIAKAVFDEALTAIAAAKGISHLIINPTGFARKGPIFSDLNVEKLVNSQFQKVEGGFLCEVGELPPYSILSLQTASANTTNSQPAQATVIEDGEQPGTAILENSIIRAEFSSQGDLIRLYDKAAGREILPAGGSANIFQAFEDRPNAWDAWDIDIHYDDRMWLAKPADSIQVIEAGPLRASLFISRRILNSVINQKVSLAAESRRLDFETSIDWHDQHVLLKVAFPVDILSPEATYEIQWGNVQRPTHRNTSWDWARFETVAQKWVDLSEGGYGVSLLNNGKYGHDIHDNIMRLTLLRSPTNPDPHADQGEHRFTYSLFPHPDSWDERSIAEAYFLNDPLIIWQQRSAVSNQQSSNSYQKSKNISLVSCDTPSLVIETVKRAEDHRGIIVRLYESQRRRGVGRLHLVFPVKEAWRTNLLEENRNTLHVEGRSVMITFRPYEIITLRIISGN